MAKSDGLYNSYLLRVWRDEGNGRTRIHLEQIGKEQDVLHFADVDSFIGYLLSTAALDTGLESKSKGDQPY
ncbi:MAG: hypothetical protein KC445_10185 [Anaerolineales bacterium]|nr:hypothetical protein [Anaerolineales bacterium]